MTRAPLFVLLALLVGCGGDVPPVPGAGPPGADEEEQTEHWAPTPDPPEGGWQIESGPLESTANTDSAFCLFGSFPEGPDLAVNHYSFHQHPTLGHHLNFYLHNEEDTPPEGVSVPCELGEMNGGELVFEGNTAAEDGSGGAMILPEGMAVHIDGGQKFYIESHYVNYTDSDQTFHDYVNIGFLEYDAVETWVTSFNNAEGDLDIPPQQESQTIIDCVWPKDMIVASMMGHMHFWGTGFTVDLVHAEDGSIDRVYDLSDWDVDWMYDPVLEDFDGEGLQVREGDRFITTCSFDNTTDEAIGFPQEMCVTAGTVWGAMRPLSCERFEPTEE